MIRRLLMGSLCALLLGCGSPKQVYQEKKEPITFVYVPYEEVIEIPKIKAPRIQSRLPQIHIPNLCLAQKGDEYVAYSGLSIDPECKYDYLRMDTEERFILVCQTECPTPEDVLDYGFNKVSGVFDRLEEGFGVGFDSDLTPIEVHLNASDYCGNILIPHASREEGRGFICVPVWDQYEGNVDEVRDMLEGNSMVGHEATHLLHGGYVDDPYAFAEMVAYMGESVAKGVIPDLCNPFNNRREFYTNGHVDYVHLQLAYDLCTQTSFDFGLDLPLYMQGVRDLKSEVGVPVPFVFASEVLGDVMGEDMDRFFVEHGLAPFFELPYVKEGVDLFVQDILYFPEYQELYGIICNLGPEQAEHSNTDLIVNGDVHRMVQMTEKVPYSCSTTRGFTLEELDLDLGDVVNVQVVVDSDERVDEVDEENNLYQGVIEVKEYKPDVSVDSIYSTYFDFPDHLGRLYIGVCSDVPFNYELYADDVLVAEGEFSSRYRCSTVNFRYPSEELDYQSGKEVSLRFVADPLDEIEEDKEDNNVYSETLVLP